MLFLFNFYDQKHEYQYRYYFYDDVSSVIFILALEIVFKLLLMLQYILL